MATLAKPVLRPPAVPHERPNLGYRLMLLFSFLYYFRPEDIIPGLAVLHLAKITGILALLALVFGSKSGKSRNIPPELMILFALFGWTVLDIPFAYWRGGSFQIVFWQFSKAVIIAVTLMLTVSRTVELRRLIFVQALGVSLMTIASIIVNHRMQDRLAGIGDGLLSNPNDLAINIALNWPFCLAFLLLARGLARKAFWGLAMLAMIYAVMATYSRAGFLALSLAILLCLWEFGVRGKRVYMVAAAVICAVLLIVAVPQNYGKRLQTLVGRFQQGDKDNGSAEARRDILVRSLKITVTHPVFGVGPGNFQAYTRLWRGTHNTYTQFSAECGIPALLLFLLLLARAVYNLKRARWDLRSSEHLELQLYASALWVGLAAYFLGACFANTAYHLFPYYLVTYTTLLYRLAAEEKERSRPAVTQKPRGIYQRAYRTA